MLLPHYFLNRTHIITVNPKKSKEIMRKEEEKDKSWFGRKRQALSNWWNKKPEQPKKPEPPMIKEGHEDEELY
jgi:hypothetical protein